MNIVNSALGAAKTVVQNKQKQEQEQKQVTFQDDDFDLKKQVLWKISKTITLMNDMIENLAFDEVYSERIKNIIISLKWMYKTVKNEMRLYKKV